LVADGISKYDPNYASQAFSLIGMSGTYAGAGDTEDRRLDSSLKYSATIMDLARVGLMYKFNGSNGAANTAFQADLGADYAGASADAYFAKTRSAISAAPLSAACAMPSRRGSSFVSDHSAQPAQAAATAPATPIVVATSPA